MKKIITIVLALVLIVVSVGCFVSCNDVPEPNTGDDGSETPPSMHNPQADLSGLNLDECKNYCVDGFNPIFPRVGNELKSTTDYSYSDINTYYTELRNPQSVISKESIYDQIDVSFNVDYPWNTPEFFGLATDDYTSFDVECVRYPSDVMMATLRMFYSKADKKRLEFFGPQTWENDEKSLCTFSIGENNFTLLIGGASCHVEVGELIPVKTSSEINKNERVQCTSLDMTVWWEYDDVLYSFNMPVMTYVGNPGDLYMPCSELVAFAKEYYDGSYDIFTYSDEHLDELKDVCGDYIKVRLLGKKIVGYLFPRYMVGDNSK